MTQAVAFQTRARTIDHLGREQIADVPTAVSELWKNAYDAYARQVALHIYGGINPVAAIIDDGFGMNRAQFVDNWLVIGTASKVGPQSVPAEMRDHLPERPKQGQKGIGRLSVAALGSTVLVVSKQKNSPFVACLVDWRLFENPFLFLHDVHLPVVEFGVPEELPALLPDMRRELVANISGIGAEKDRSTRLIEAWRACDEMERAQAPDTRTISQEILRAAEGALPNVDHLRDWPVWLGLRPTGTALVMADLNSFLTAWIAEGETADGEQVGSVKDSLVRTLTGFSDPYAGNLADVMDYQVVVHARDGDRVVVSRDEGYGLEFLRSLDHCLDGEFDEHGIFRGQLRAFGRDFGSIELIPSYPPPTISKDRIGPFSIAISAFEPVALSSILAPDVHEKVAARARTHSGLSVYRDGLRVMPYGRPENDFFKIEERRQYQAGREFWASRRLFGRIAISRARNPNLRDKAGREGLIDNGASRAMQLLIIDLLKTTARRYFGGDSPYRAELLPAIEAENEAAASKAKAARNRQLGTFRTLVRQQAPALERALEAAESLLHEIEAAAAANDADALWQLADRVEAAVSTRADLRLPPKPRNLGGFEQRYREYRDRFAVMASRVDDIRIIWVAQTERLQAKPAIEVARSHFGRNQKSLTDRLSRWRRSIESVLKNEIERIDTQIDQDQKEFYKIAASLLDDVEAERSSLAAVLDEMHEITERLTRQFADSYEPYLRAIEQLAEGIDLDAALAYTGAREVSLERKLEQIQGLAQIGISVEILGHELHTLDRRLASSLAALPPEVQETETLRQADTARKELVERLKFLSQVQIAGGDVRQRITGVDIQTYLSTFFGTTLKERQIRLEFTKEFRQASFQEFPSRVFPVFINLVNNSLYWLTGRSEKRILLSAGDGTLRLSDTGPGVDPDDIENLFELFFTRRVRGRGVGLYLCRQTLAAGGHRIDYVSDELHKILPGANFVITLRNGFDG